METKAANRRGRRVGSAGGSERGRKRARRTAWAANGSPGSSASASTPAAGDGRVTMDNMWNHADAARTSFEFPEVQYTPGIDLSENMAKPGAEVTMPLPTTELLNKAPRRSWGKGCARGVSTRTGNFKSIEDEVLCFAYLNVSKDSIVGVNQPQGGYWARIMQFYMENRKTATDRTQSSLQHKWGDIMKGTSRFCGFYAEIERQHQSGKNEDDKVKDALQMFEGIVGSPFKFLHCWFILRNKMKWNAQLATMHAQGSGDAAEGVEAEADPTLPPRMERPVGRDRAKNQRSNTQSSPSSACLEVLQKMSMDQLAHAERQETANNEEVNDVASRSDRKLALQEKMVQIHMTQAEIAKDMLKRQIEESEEHVMSIDREDGVMGPRVLHTQAETNFSEDSGRFFIKRT